MRKTYSANDLLRNLAQSLGFKVYIFDDPQIGPEIRLREQSKNGEIDGVLLYKNLICLVGISKGRNVEKKIEKYFEKLDKVREASDLELSLDISARNRNRIKSQKQVAEALLEDINNNAKRTSNDYDLILRKIFFCPNKEIEEKIIDRKQEHEFIIDKDTFEYFQEVLNRLDRDFLFYDFMHFLRVRKVDLQKKGMSRTREPAKSSPFRVERVELEKDKLIMYSLSPRVEDIKGYVTVLRIARKYDKRGFQRMIKPTRLRKINDEYLRQNYTFPNNIIIALDPESYKKEEDFYNSKKRKITFFDEFNSLIIIDGQHRFFSFAKGQKLNRYILTTLIFFNEFKEKDFLMEKMFYKINKTQERIDPNLSFVLKAKIDPDSEENFWYTVFKKLDKKGFFAGRYSFKETTMRTKEAKKSIISVVTYGGVLRLNRRYKREGIEVPGLDRFYQEDKQANVNFAFNLVKNYFDVVETAMHSQAVNKDHLTPREIGALLRLIKHFMITDENKLRILGTIKNITTSKDKGNRQVVEHFRKVLGYIPFADTIKLDYPASNWAAVEGSMLRKINNKDVNFGNKNLLSKKGLEIYESTR